MQVIKPVVIRPETEYDPDIIGCLEEATRRNRAQMRSGQMAEGIFTHANKILDEKRANQA